MNPPFNNFDPPSKIKTTQKMNKASAIKKLETCNNVRCIICYVMKEMYAALGIGHAHIFRKDNFIEKDDGGRVIMGLGSTLPNHVPACRSEFRDTKTL